MAKDHPFLYDIIERTLIILNHKQFQDHVLNELCAQVTKTRTRECEQLQQFIQQGCAQLRIQACVDKLDVPDVLMQCEPVIYNDSQPCKIFVSQSVSTEKISKIIIHLSCSGIGASWKSNHIVKNINFMLFLVLLN